MKIQYIGRNLSGVIFTKIFTIEEIEQNEVFRWVKKNNIVPSSQKRHIIEEKEIKGKNHLT